jgi:hypothetical protein
MHNRLPVFFLIILVSICLSSCAVHDDPRVDEALTPKNMDYSFEYPQGSIKPYEKCQEVCEVALINAEPRKDKYIYWNPAGVASYTPQVFTGTVIRYMGDELSTSRGQIK